MKNSAGNGIFTQAPLCALAGMLLGACGAPGQVGVGPSTKTGGNGGAITIKLDGGRLPQGGAGGSGGSTVGPPPSGDANCGQVTSNTSRAPADVLLVLDRSGSMTSSMTDDTNCAAGSTTCTSRWAGLTTALATTLTATPDVSWGLEFFTTPGSGSCAVSATPQVAIGTPTASADIQAQIAGASPGDNTPTAAAVTAATAYLKTVNDANNKFILLATDGEPNCKAGGKGGGSGASDMPGALAAITAAKAAGFSVYVIGIGPSVGNLDNMAQAGGTTTSYPATSPDQLTNALVSISQKVATCSFTSTQAPPDPNNIGVYLDKNLVPQDANNGWTFGSSQQTITLTGSYCDQITSGSATQVQILFGCAGISPPSFIP